MGNAASSEGEQNPTADGSPPRAARHRRTESPAGAQASSSPDHELPPFCLSHDQHDEAGDAAARRERRSAAARSVRFAEPETPPSATHKELLKELLARPELLAEGDDSVELRGLVRNLAQTLSEREEAGSVPTWEQDEPFLAARDAELNAQNTVRRLSLDIDHRELHKTAAQALKGIRAAAAAVETAAIETRAQGKGDTESSTDDESSCHGGGGGGTSGVFSLGRGRRGSSSTLGAGTRDDGRGHFGGRKAAEAAAESGDSFTTESHVREVASHVSAVPSKSPLARGGQGGFRSFRGAAANAADAEPARTGGGWRCRFMRPRRARDDAGGGGGAEATSSTVTARPAAVVAASPDAGSSPVLARAAAMSHAADGADHSPTSDGTPPLGVTAGGDGGGGSADVSEADATDSVASSVDVVARDAAVDAMLPPLLLPPLHLAAQGSDGASEGGASETESSGKTESSCSTARVLSSPRSPHSPHSPSPLGASVPLPHPAPADSSRTDDGPSDSDVSERSEGAAVPATAAGGDGSGRRSSGSGERHSERRSGRRGGGRFHVEACSGNSAHSRLLASLVECRRAPPRRQHPRATATAPTAAAIAAAAAAAACRP